MSQSDVDIIRKKHETRGLSMDTNTDLRWRLLAGRIATEDGNLMLSAAVPIIHVRAAVFNLIYLFYIKFRIKYFSFYSPFACDFLGQ